MANIINQFGQVKVGFRSNQPTPSISTVWNNIYSVYNADSVGSSSLKTSLVSAYNFDNNLNDSFGTNNGTGFGGINYGTTSGLIGTSIGFNGTNAYVNLPNNTGQFNFTDDFSISLWVKPSTTAGFPFLINNYVNIGSNNYGYYLFITSTGLRLGIWNGASSAITDVNQLPAVNVWSNIVITRKKSTITKIYINGVLTTPTSSTNPTLNATYQPNTIMTLGASFGNYKYSGWMDSLNFWTKELTQSEITELYNSGNGAQYIGDNFYKPTTNDALNTYNGTAQGGLTYDVGKVGTAFKFNGTNAYVSLPDNSMNLTGDFTISLWVYYTATGGQTFFGSGFYNPTSNIYKGWAIEINNSGVNNNRVQFFIPAGTTTPLNYTLWEFRDTPLTLNAWNHIFIQRVSGVNTYCWINNISQTYNLRGGTSGPNISFDPIYHTTNRVSIGAKTVYTPALYVKANTRMDALTVWNRQLTSDERDELYNSGNGKQYSN